MGGPVDKSTMTLTPRRRTKNNPITWGLNIGSLSYQTVIIEKCLYQKVRVYMHENVSAIFLGNKDQEN